MKIETIILNEERNVTLTCYLQDVGGAFRMQKRPAIVVLPGGGYQYCSDREADPVAFAYMKAGFHAFILRYSVKEHSVWPNPLNDFDQAMALIRRNADAWHVYADKIAVIGFSAGGHLAAAAATMSVNRPNAAILGYGVVGEDVQGCNTSAPDTIAAVDKRTCPCFLFSSRTDELVPVQNSIRFMQALCDHNIGFESHIYAYGPHGFSTCDSSIHKTKTPICRRVPNWVDDSIGWLKDIFGDFEPDSPTLGEPACGPYANGNNDPQLSIDCTTGHLLDNPAAADILKPLLGAAETPELGKGGDPMKLMGQLPLRTLLGMAGVSDSDCAALDAQLRDIPND